MADVFGTLISERPYKPSSSPGKSFTIIKNGRGMHFDPDIINAITMQDLDGRILAWNPGVVRMYGWSEAEALAMNVREPDPEEAARGSVGHGTYVYQAEILEPIARNGSPETVRSWKSR